MGALNDADVIIDCVNYGSVKASNEREGAVGGVCATVSRSARVKSCINRGEVIFEGAAPLDSCTCVIHSNLSRKKSMPSSISLS